MMTLKPLVTIQHSVIIDLSPHTVHFIPVIHLFCNWKFVNPLNPHHILRSPPHLPRGLWQLPICYPNPWPCFCFTFVHLFYLVEQFGHMKLESLTPNDPRIPLLDMTERLSHLHGNVHCSVSCKVVIWKPPTYLWACMDVVSS